LDKDVIGQVLAYTDELVEVGKSLDVTGLDPVRDTFTTAHAALTPATLDRMGMFRQSLGMLRTAQSSYQTALNTLTSQLQAGRISSSAALARFKVSANSAYRDAFLAGTYRAGNPYYKDLGLTRKDTGFVRRMGGIESRYWKGLQKDMLNPAYPRWRVGWRLEMYGQAINSQYWNGYVAGLPETAMIAWMLGTPRFEHCPDCLSLQANSPYLRAVLPTVPKSGDTQCMTRCYCMLREISRQDAMDRGLIPPGVGMTPSEVYGMKPVDVIGAGGLPVSGDIAAVFTDLYSEINRLRQLMELDIANVERYIGARKALLQQVRSLKTTHAVRVIPRYSVEDLVRVVRSLSKAGWELQQTMESFTPGLMTYDVRNQFIRAGIVNRIEADTIYVQTAQGEVGIVVNRGLVFIKEVGV